MDKHTIRLLAVLLPVLLAFGASANPDESGDELRIGDSRIDPAFITPYTSRFELTRIDADGTRVPHGQWTDHVDFLERGGSRLLRREVSRSTAAGVEDMRRLHLVDASSLAPKVTDQRGENGSVSHLDFAGPKVTATILQNSESAVLQVPLEFEESPFDLSIWATLLMSMPFEVGASFRIPVLGTGGVLQWETVTIEGEEEIVLPNGRQISTVRVSTSNRPWTAWLSKHQAPHIFRGSATLSRWFELGVDIDLIWQAMTHVRE